MSGRSRYHPASIDDVFIFNCLRMTVQSFESMSVTHRCVTTTNAYRYLLRYGDASTNIAEQEVIQIDYSLDIETLQRKVELPEDCIIFNPFGVSAFSTNKEEYEAVNTFLQHCNQLNMLIHGDVRGNSHQKIPYTPVLYGRLGDFRYLKYMVFKPLNNHISDVDISVTVKYDHRLKGTYIIDIAVVKKNEGIDMQHQQQQEHGREREDEQQLHTHNEVRNTTCEALKHVDSDGDNIAGGQRQNTTCDTLPNNTTVTQTNVKPSLQSSDEVLSLVEWLRTEVNT